MALLARYCFRSTLLFSAFALLFSCGSTEPKVFSAKGEGQFATISHRGYQFWLKSEEKRGEDGQLIKEKFDTLQLKPGGYLIGFIRSTSRAGGAAFCKVEAGKTYSLEVTGQEYMPKSGRYILRGKCVFDPQRPENAGVKAGPKTESK